MGPHGKDSPGWYGMKMDDIRKYEEKTVKDLEKNRDKPIDETMVIDMTQD